MIAKNYLALLSIIAFFAQASGQLTSKDIPDSLLIKEYSYFIEQLESDDHDEQTARIYSAAYLAKAKSEANWKEMVNAYKSILHQSPKEMHLAYADSMVYAARHTSDNLVTASAFLTKGIVYYNLKQQNNALDNFLIADGLLAKKNDTYLAHKVKFNIAKVKYYLGFYIEALPLFKECVVFFKNREDESYLVSLHHLGLCYIKTKKYDLCTATNSLGVKEAFRIDIPEAIPHFIHSEGINQFHKKNYGIAIMKLQQSLPGIVKSKDVANETLAYFYIGKSYWGLRQYSKAVSYFQKVDKAFENKNFIQPDLRENYERLIDYYKSNKDLKTQLYYIDRLLAADRLLEKNYKYLSGKIYKEYNTQELLKSKKDIEISLQKEKERNAIAIGVIILLSLLVIYLTYKYFENRFYKRKYKEFMARKNGPKDLQSRFVKSSGPLDINQEVVNTIRSKMEVFEEEHGYLEKGLKQEKLAIIFESNPKYISKIIKHYRNKKSNDYINDLRIDYAIELLRREKKYRNYTIQSLGDEVGFTRTQHFTRAFYAKTGMAASFFIKQLKAELKEKEKAE